MQPKLSEARRLASTLSAPKEADDCCRLIGRSWRPRFADPGTERSFRREYSADALGVSRLSLGLMLLIWVGFAGVDVLLEEPQRSWTLAIRLGLVTPLLAGLMALSFTRWGAATRSVLLLVAVTTIQGGLFWVVSLYDFTRIASALGQPMPLHRNDAGFIFMMVWLCVICVSTGLLRLGTVATTVACGMFLFWSVSTAMAYRPSLIIAATSVPFAFAAVMVSWVGSLMLQRYARSNFRARQLLHVSMLKSESLLLNILPEAIAERLKSAESNIADGFDEVTVLLADIEDFTPLASQLEPARIVALLDELFRLFDEICARHEVEKIKTVGDAYMAASGIPQSRADHCSVMAQCAVEMLDACQRVADPRGGSVRLRIGLHTGPVVAGVIGTHKFAYDLWGDTVNVASRMESTGEPGRIQVTREVVEKLTDGFAVSRRGQVKIKGKGLMPSWWLTKGDQGSEI